MKSLCRFALPMAGTVALLLSGCGEKAADAPDATAIQTTAATASDAAPMSSPPASEPSLAVTDTLPPGTPGKPATPRSCSADIGEAAARKLATQCRAVSPATRPPCNVANSCVMIRNEIARGCAMLGEDADKTPECAVSPIGPEAAADAVERYYEGINARDYAAAWSLWGPDGKPGQTLTAFEKGYANTLRTHVQVGKVSEVEGAAGSLYVTVPVLVNAELSDGKRQRFVGTYELRQINRGMGLSQGWHIMTAKLRPA